MRGCAQNGLEGIKRAGTDIAEHDAKRGKAQNRQLALRDLSGRLTGGGRLIVSHFEAADLWIDLAAGPQENPDHRRETLTNTSDGQQPVSLMRDTIALQCDIQMT
jgi:hypothetical protein